VASKIATAGGGVHFLRRGWYKILRRLTAYEVYGGLRRRLGALDKTADDHPLLSFRGVGSSVARCLSFPRSAPCTAAGAITRDGVAAAAGRGGYLTLTVKVVYFRPASSNFDYRLLTGQYTIDYRLRKKFESSIPKLYMDKTNRVVERLPYQNNTCIHWISSTLTLVNTGVVPIR